jgi:hypothetical protein
MFIASSYIETTSKLHVPAVRPSNAVQSVAIQTDLTADVDVASPGMQLGLPAHSHSQTELLRLIHNYVCICKLYKHSHQSSCNNYFI